MQLDIGRVRVWTEVRAFLAGSTALYFRFADRGDTYGVWDYSRSDPQLLPMSVRNQGAEKPPANVTFGPWNGQA